MISVKKFWTFLNNSVLNGGGYKKIINPISQNPLFFLFQFLILNAPVWIYWITQYSPYIRQYTILATPIIIFAAYTLTVIVQYVPKSKIVLYVISYALSIFEVYLILNFGSRFSHTFFQMILETNSGEAVGFISSYIFTRKTLTYGIFVLVFIVANIFAEKILRVKLVIIRFIQSISNKLCLLIISALMLFGAISIYRDIRFIKSILSYNHTEVLGVLERYTYGTNYTTLGRGILASYTYLSTLDEADILSETLSNISNVTSDFTSRNIVLILGESFNKHHSSLYGYNLETNPNLKEEKDNLYLMSDVISPHNSTAKCLRRLFSFSNQDNNLYWANTPLFPALFKYVGYNVTFFSNQECLSINHNPWDLINNALISPSTIPYLYDNTNSSIHQFDLDLIAEFKSIFQANSEKPNLVIFHLLGQHVPYKAYPDSEIVFEKDNYKDRIDLSEDQKQIVADYDNATRYNDKVVSSIIDVFRDEDVIIVYLSDHGDEVYDYRDSFGRSHESIITKQRAMCQYEVPFMIWMSDKYKETHRGLVNQIEESVNRPFMTDDLPHLMLDLAGIECEWYDSSRSLINNQYNMNRKRLLEDSKQDYDEIVENIE